VTLRFVVALCGLPAEQVLSFTLRTLNNYETALLADELGYVNTDLARRTHGAYFFNERELRHKLDDAIAPTRKEE
jgi:hypothetical protein